MRTYSLYRRPGPRRPAPCTAMAAGGATRCTTSDRAKPGRVRQQPTQARPSRAQLGQWDRVWLGPWATGQTLTAHTIVPRAPLAQAIALHLHSAMVLQGAVLLAMHGVSCTDARDGADAPWGVRCVAAALQTAVTSATQPAERRSPQRKGDRDQDGAQRTGVQALTPLPNVVAVRRSGRVHVRNGAHSVGGQVT